MAEQVVQYEAYSIMTDREIYKGTYKGSPEDIKAYCYEVYGEGYGWKFKPHHVKCINKGYAENLKTLKQVKAELEKQVKRVNEELKNLR